MTLPSDSGGEHSCQVTQHRSLSLALSLSHSPSFIRDNGRAVFCLSLCVTAPAAHIGLSEGLMINVHLMVHMDQGSINLRMIRNPLIQTSSIFKVVVVVEVMQYVAHKIIICV